MQAHHHYILYYQNDKNEKFSQPKKTYFKELAEGETGCFECVSGLWLTTRQLTGFCPEHGAGKGYQ